MPTDTLTVLTSLDNPATKTFKMADEEYQPVKSGHATKFNVEEVEVGTLGDLAQALEGIQSDSQKVVIRGQLADLDCRQDIRRQNVNFRAAGRRWCLIDIDDLILPPEYRDYPSYIPEIVKHTVSYLPSEFQGVDCWYQFSSSMGIKQGRIRVHLWYWLDRKVSDEEMKAWLDGCPVDTKLFHQVQMHFTAKPIFLDGAVDPVPVRSGIFRGGRIDTVPVPSDLEPDRK